MVRQNKMEDAHLNLSCMLTVESKVESKDTGKATELLERGHMEYG